MKVWSFFNLNNEIFKDWDPNFREKWTITPNPKVASHTIIVKIKNHEKLKIRILEKSPLIPWITQRESISKDKRIFINWSLEKNTAASIMVNMKINLTSFSEKELKHKQLPKRKIKKILLLKHL